MTNEELKIHLLLLKENARGIEDTIIQNVKKESFVWIIDEAIKALEQEPFINKTCVSEKVCEHDKQIVLDKIRDELHATEEMREDRIEQIKTEMCEYYCRFPYIWDPEQNGCELSESEVCERCPLRRL